MLQITIPGKELFNSSTNEFLYTKPVTLSLEHSLISIKKWESKWNKPFLSEKNERTLEQSVDYVRCMTITPNVDPSVYENLTDRNFREIDNYINAPMTATWFSNDKKQKTGKKQVITAEIIYYWMIAYNIPFECQKWHINSLLTLIRVCEIKNAPSKKMSRKDTLSNYKALNAARRARLGTNG